MSVRTLPPQVEHEGMQVQPYVRPPPRQTSAPSHVPGQVPPQPSEVPHATPAGHEGVQHLRPKQTSPGVGQDPTEQMPLQPSEPPQVAHDGKHTQSSPDAVYVQNSFDAG
jgi:hypothetical protein